MKPHRLRLILKILVALAFTGIFASASAAERKLANKLATSSSLYLREAASQPVAWYPWGDEPFRLAKELDRPILLDIGAIWCHWCHVMDHETYGNPEVAKLINGGFVAIKVDRDERPDIDARYQRVVQTLTGQGGWPLTVFLNAEGQAFYGGGTFFPDDRFGCPGFKSLLPRIVEAYHRQRKSLQGTADKLHQAVTESEAQALRSAPLSPQLVESIAQAMVRAFDEAHGGFGRRAKFPAGSALEFALRLYAESGDRKMLQLVTKTLDAMASGGIHDQLGGGFHRYAVDQAWRVPHFEKLDSGNAQLLINYLQAYQATGAARHRDVAERIVAYVSRDLSDHAHGGFYAHQDADTAPGDDGGYYTWTIAEVTKALSKEEAEVILRYYDVKGQGEMGETPDRNVLWVAATPEAIARELSIPLAKVERLVASGNQHLRQARARRKAPLIDRVRYADRNAMMISAYLEAYKILGREELKAFALKSLEFLLGRCRSKDGAIYHTCSDGDSRVHGFLNDYVWVADALLQAFQVTGDARYLATARQVMDGAHLAFWDKTGGGYFDLRPEPRAVGPLKRPSKSFEDSSLPSPNAIAALVLDRLAYLTNVKAYQERSQQLLEAFAGAAPQSGLYASSYALAVDLHLHPPAHAVIIGAMSDARTRDLWRAALAAFRPGKIVAVYDPTRVKSSDLPPPVASAMRTAQSGGVPQAYICVGTACSLPTGEPEETAALVRTFAQQRSPERAGVK